MAISVAIATLLAFQATTSGAGAAKYENETESETTDRMLTLGYLVPWSHDWAIGPAMGSAIILGIEEVKSRALLPGYEISWTLRDTWCKPLQAMKMVVDIWSKEDDLDGIIGDGCSVGCEPAGLLSASWGIPCVSWACNSLALSEKSTFPTFTRVSHTNAALAPIMTSLLGVFNWTTVGVLASPDEVSKRTADIVVREMERNEINVERRIIHQTMKGNDIDAEAYQAMADSLSEIKDKVRILFLFVYASDFRNILVAAHDMSLLKGEYVFIGTDIGYLLTAKFSFRPELGPELLQGVLIGSPSVPSGPKWNEFSKRVLEAFEDPAFDDVTHITNDITKVDNYAGMVHDAVLMWAYGVNKTLTQGYDPSNGVKVTGNIFNLTFEGITGTVAIDHRGDRKPNYKIEMVQDGGLVTILHWVPAENMMSKSWKPSYPQDWSGLYWTGNSSKVPKDSPACGWNGEFCEEKSNSLTVIVIVAVIFIVIVTAIGTGAFFIRKVRYESKLTEATSCVISWNQVDETKSDMFLSRLTLQSVGTTETRQQQFIHVVRFNSEMAAIKSLGNNPVDIKQREVLIELKSIKEIQHENINAFFGICVEASHACVLVAYVPRGSLQDVLLADDVKLTWDFKLSLATDIASGMKYLHSSEIGYHGNLTSSNCLVNSRWVCKVTDYGLRHVKEISGIKADHSTDSLLWKSPELLREGAATPAMFKKNDVFSFGIICQEIVLQNVPYCYNESDLESSEIVSKVRQGLKPPYRPHLPTDSCSDHWRELMFSCWQENPDGRPNFSRVLNMIRVINGGRDITLVDNMIKRLEVHTNHLEEVVADRSKELNEEKLKVEILLLELLPRSIADCLKRGQKVLPETFENVTIFFSDIVSFTRISAAGTPIDVVKMLNLMYTLFDDISVLYDVYKVATIGDAYFVASGVPIKNGNKHAGEICRMALNLLEAVSNLPIPHLPDETLQLRIGIHSGSCVAGVAGIKMPRYLLFGDTIDIASRMESGGEKMKIHLSPTTAELIQNTTDLPLEPRGRIDVKGLGYVMTYFLTDGSTKA